MGEMERQNHLDAAWQDLLGRLPESLDLDESARAYGALKRRRAIRDGATLLRLALAYGPGGMSLRSAAAWAGGHDIADLSDVGLLKRLRGASDWLGHVAATLLDRSPVNMDTAASKRKLRIVDGSIIRSPGKGGVDWRLHATYDAATARFSELEISDIHEGESLSRASFEPGDLVLADRGYARTPGLQHVMAMGADFITRIGWSTIRLLTMDGTPVDWEAIYADMQPGEFAEHPVLVDHSGRKGEHRGKSTFAARLIVRRKDDIDAEHTVKNIHRSHRKRRRIDREPRPLTISSAGFILLLTSVPAEEMTAEEIGATYRLRWQIELAFKRLKSGLGIDALPARDQRLARAWLTAHLILGLMIDEAVDDGFAFSP